MKQTILLTIASLTLSLGANAFDYTDDIYYNPKKNISDNAKSVSSKSPSSYVDFSTMSVDEYNKRGQYYSSPVDTIGLYMENEPDFVYTTQIQKYYNPTIVTDNADVLKDVLNNSYGNIEIVYNYNGAPSFVPWSYYNWPYYSWAYNSWYSPWSWGFNVGPFSFGWNSWWNWGPSWGWGWNWGPSWAWGGPGWGGPGWGHPWRPGWGNPGWGRPHPRPMATYSPGGRAPFGGPHTMATNRPNGNFNGSHSTGTPNQVHGVKRPSTTTIQHGNNVSPSFGNGRKPAVSGNNTVHPSSTQPANRGNVASPNAVTTGRQPATPSRQPQTTQSTTGRQPASTTTKPSVSTPNKAPTTNSGTTTRQPTTTTPSRQTTTTRPSTSSPSRGSFNSGGVRSGGSSGSGRGSFGGGRSGGGGRR